MYRNLTVMVLTAVLTVSLGCHGTPKGRLHHAYQVYEATAELVPAYREAGWIDDEDVPDVRLALTTAWTALDEWHDAVDAGDEATAEARAAEAALRHLLTELTAREETDDAE
jgi:transposase